MAVLHLLGTGAVRTDPHRTTTMLALETDRDVVLVDCGGDAVQRALTAGIPTEKLIGGRTSLIVTHEHADHVGGFALLLERLWLLGLRTPLPVYGIAPAIAQARAVHDAFDTSTWPDYPGARYHTVEHAPNALVLETPAVRITATPGIHTVPTVALRFDPANGSSATYSGDTRYAPTVVELARGSDLLIHEATCEGAGCDQSGHASAADAARVAAEASVRRALLVHLPPAETIDATLAAAREVFPAIAKADELQRVTLEGRGAPAPATVGTIRT